MSHWTPDFCFELLKQHEPLIAAAAGTNEAMTRLRAIDTILFDVLGWDKLRVDVEKYCREVGYADYAMHSDEALPMILEAKKATDAETKKKIGESFVLPSKVKFPANAIGFSLLAKECPEADKALRQSSGYAASLGARYIAISNGHQWLISLSWLDGVPVDERSVIVFESLDAIKNKFRLFWECFSPNGVATNRVLDKLLDSRKAPPPNKLSQRITGYPNPVQPNQAAEDIALVLGDVWTDLQNEELELEFLEECYVIPSSKSATLEFAKDLIEQKYRSDENVTATILKSAQVPGLIASYQPQRPIIVLGNVGNGKTTFLRYLRMIEASKTLEKYIQLEIDFLDRLTDDREVSDYVYRTIEEQLMKPPVKMDVLSDKLIRSILKNELKRFPNTPAGKAFPQSSPEYIKAELEFINGFCADKHDFYRRVFRSLRGERQYTVAIFMDNLDRCPDRIQEAAFLRASAIARDWACLVFVCLRPATFYKSSQSGVLDTVSPKVISITSADSDIVLTRRLKYAKRYAEGKLKSQQSRTAQYGSKFSYEMPTVAAVIQCLLDSIRSRGGSDIVQLFSSAANNNTRAMLVLVKKYLTSKFLDSRTIAESYMHDASYRIYDYQIIRTLMLGDSVHYDPSSSPFCNIFDIQHANPVEHFSRVTALNFLNTFADSQPQQAAYVRVSDVKTHLCTMGYTAEHAHRTVQFLFEKQCIESRDPIEKWSDSIEFICITHRGKYHVAHLISRFNYLDAVSIDTPILDDATRAELRDVRTLEDRVRQCALFVEYLDKCSEGILDVSVRSLWKTAYSQAMNEMARIQDSVLEAKEVDDIG
ncbi:hypothetical protein R5W23_003719 [Gemmata sp. JC673]|uniref:Type I restriction enzyme R protein N-terminal domain-containing protein n=1 Tax=Gemmata algarum TaxID=2975278 RepID=A0ABU5F635_9BACT|nr:hypothetical protein [Gemmata algarum]MDY3562257.1 hypothetical protein [Gemmata algarum]